MRTLSDRLSGIERTVALVVVAVACQSMASAGVITINPSDDGAVWSSGIVHTDMYLDVANNVTGVVEFPLAQVNGPIEVAFLSVNPYALPMWGNTIDVYGYESEDGVVTQSDAEAGTFVGTWELPVDLGFGEDAFFEVTELLQGVSSPFVGFNLRNGDASLSSLEYNYGHPAQLTITTPEPPMPIGATALGMATASICLAGAFALKKRMGEKHKPLLVPWIGNCRGQLWKHLRIALT